MSKFKAFVFIMGIVLKYIVDHSDNRLSSYDTRKQMIDESELETFAEFEDHSEDKVEVSAADKYAESNPVKEKWKIIDSEKIRQKLDKSPMKYFIDGSRHVYKTGDVVISGVVYPVVAGQAIVGCCTRNNRNMLKYDYTSRIILAMPDRYDYDRIGENFFRKKTEEINEAIAKSGSRYNSIRFDAIVPYKTDGPKLVGRNKYLHQAIAVIQNEMMDQERLKVKELCDDHMLGDDAWLIKDGTLEYKKDFTNRPDEELDSAMFEHNMQNVIGVSKLFDPELLYSVEPKIGRIISEMPSFARTNAFKYKHENREYCVWYLRIRQTPNKSSSISDVIKVEFIMTKGNKVNSNRIDTISAHLINEAYPVCFGKDSRWANHIYPVYVTETYSKSKYINDQIIIKLI